MTCIFIAKNKSVRVITKEIYLFLNKYFLNKYFYLLLLSCFQANNIDISLSSCIFSNYYFNKNSKYVFFVLLYTNISKHIIDKSFKKKKEYNNLFVKTATHVYFLVHFTQRIQLKRLSWLIIIFLLFKDK